MDAGVAAVARAAAAGKIQDAATENAIIDALLNREEDVLLLAKHYAGVLPERFMQHASRVVTRAGRIAVRFSAGDAAPAAPMASKDTVDVVVIGGGLAGLSAALTILDAGGRVVLLEKMGHLGGNSAWASSGINAVDVNDTSTQDTVEIFTADVTKAAGRGDNPLISVLTSGSVDALAWLRSRVKENLNLDLVGQMGGHSKARTHRPSSGLAGSAMIFALQKQLEKYTVEPAGGGKPPFELMKWTRATALVTHGDAVRGVEYAVVTAKDQETPVRNGVVLGEHVLLATGGYASDYTADSLLKKHRPDLLKYATTNNKGTTGDGHKLALDVGAHAVDLDDVQVHPTGFHTHILPHSLLAHPLLLSLS
jgi:succinate dehydrogenase/fumarate reductase flavoprotein subunit